eukprot:15443229-Alexandrium_andersonii.AAC.1
MIKGVVGDLTGSQQSMEVRGAHMLARSRTSVHACMAACMRACVHVSVAGCLSGCPAVAF